MEAIETFTVGLNKYTFDEAAKFLREQPEFRDELEQHFLAEYVEPYINETNPLKKRFDRFGAMRAFEKILFRLEDETGINIISK